MKNLSTLLFLFAALVSPPALAQSFAPANTTSSIPQLTLPSLPTSNPAPSVSPAPASTPAPEAAPVVVPADPSAAFTAAVAAYEKGDFGRASALFAGAEKKSFSASLEYNFGNACYQSSDYGAAILHYLRALSLDPRDPDARQNLDLARKAANATAADESKFDRYSALLGRNSWAWIATVAGWAALYLAFLPGLYRWRGVAPWLLFTAAFAIAIAGGIGLWGAQKHAHDGVVLHTDTSLNLSPTANSPSIGLLQTGEIAHTLDHHGNYFKVRTSSGQLGWVEAANYSPVWE